MKPFWMPRLHADCPHGIDEVLPEIVVEAAGSSAGAGAGLSAGAIAAGAGGALAGGIGGSLLTSGGGTTATGGSVPVNSPASTTGPSTSANPGGGAAKPSNPFFGNLVKAIITSGAGSIAGAGASALLGGRRGITVPPPPGAAMIDPEGAEAAAQIRARQAVAGGLSSTVTGAGASQPAFTSATGGGKSLLGQ